MLKTLFNRIMRIKTGVIRTYLTYDSNSSSITEPVAEDIDNDNKTEILLGTQDGELICVANDGKLKWKFKASEEVDKIEAMFLDNSLGNSISAQPIIHSFEKNKKNNKQNENEQEKQIIFGTELGFVYSLNSKGKKQWSYRANGAVRGKIAVFDFDNDGKNEIVFGSLDKNLYVLSEKGKLIKKILLSSESESGTAKFGELTIIGTTDGKITAFDKKGDSIWTVETGAKITAEPEIVELSKGNLCAIIGSTDNILYCIDNSGNIVWKYATEGSIYSKVLVHDLNEDGMPEIIFGSCDNKLYVINNQGIKIWSFETDFWIVASPLLMDIDKDRTKEIVLGSYDTNIYVLSAEGAYNLDYIPGISGIVNQDGNYSEIPTQDPGELIGKKLWTLKTPGIIVGCCVADDNLIAQTKDGKLVWIRHQEQE